MFYPYEVHPLVRICYDPPPEHAMTPDRFSLLITLVSMLIMGATLIRKGLHDQREAKRIRDAMHRGERLNVVGMVINASVPRRYTLPKGEATAEMLAALAFCAVISAILLACLACADAADLATLIKPKGCCSHSRTRP